MSTSAKPTPVSSRASIENIHIQTYMCITAPTNTSCENGHDFQHKHKQIRKILQKKINHINHVFTNYNNYPQHLVDSTIKEHYRYQVTHTNPTNEIDYLPLSNYYTVGKPTTFQEQHQHRHSILQWKKTKELHQLYRENNRANTTIRSHLQH